MEVIIDNVVYVPRGEIPPLTDERLPATGSKVSESMMAWSKGWQLDGDLCRCRKCNRAIIISRMGEAFHHATDCPQAHLIAPWQDLRSRIPTTDALTSEP